MNSSTTLQKSYYDLEERTLKFAQQVIKFSGELVRTIPHCEIVRQLVRAAGSVGANYIEANEAISHKEFRLKINTCKKEAKEARYWLKLLTLSLDWENFEQSRLIQECTELMRIFGAILKK